MAAASTDQSIADGTANGFSFHDYSALALTETVRRACDVYLTQRNLWRQLIETGMGQDWSWAKSAEQYQRLYVKTVKKHEDAVLIGYR